MATKKGWQPSSRSPLVLRTPVSETLLPLNTPARPQPGTQQSMVPFWPTTAMLLKNAPRSGWTDKRNNTASSVDHAPAGYGQALGTQSEIGQTQDLGQIPLSSALMT